MELAHETGSLLVVDESHSLGTYGPSGAGLSAAIGESGRVHFRTASLAKAFAGRAGLITCTSDFKEYFRTESRPAIFSSSLLEHEYVWLESALELIRRARDRRNSLHRMSRTIRKGLEEQGVELSPGSEQIISLHAGTEPQTLHLRTALQGRGIFGAVFCPPATPRNHCLVRMSIHSKISSVDAERLITACSDAVK